MRRAIAPSVGLAAGASVGAARAELTAIEVRVLAHYDPLELDHALLAFHRVTGGARSRGHD